MRVKETVLVERTIYTVLIGLLAYVLLSPVYHAASEAIAKLATVVG